MITTTTVPTVTATIYVGLKYRYNGDIASRSAVIAAIKTYVDKVGLCVTVTDTQFVYSNGGEPGVIVGLINYPRFPSTPDIIKAHAQAIAGMLLECCRQMKVTVVMPSETVMVSNETTTREQ
jgi:hypothetical protein